MAQAFYIIRYVSKEDYAFFTISNSMVAITNVLCATGVAVGFRKLGGRLWNQPDEFRSLIASANRQRARQSAFIFPLLGGITWFLLTRQGATPLGAAGLMLLTLVVVFPDINRAVKIEALLSADRWKDVQWQKFLVVIVRSSLVVGIGLTIGLNIEQLLIAAAIGAFVGSWFIERRGRDLWEPKAEPTLRYTEEMQAMFRKTFPNATFAALQGQLVVIVLGVVGSTSSVADIGALTRLSAVFMVPSAFVSNIFAPTFSRCHSTRKLKVIYIGAILALLGFSAVSLGVVAWIPDPLLFFLGDAYNGLETELILAVGLALVIFCSRLFARLNQSKGWIDVDARWQIPTSITFLAIGAWIFEPSTVHGALWLAIFSRLPALGLRLIDGAIGLRSLGHMHPAESAR